MSRFDKCKFDNQRLAASTKVEDLMREIEKTIDEQARMSTGRSVDLLSMALDRLEESAMWFNKALSYQQRNYR